MQIGLKDDTIYSETFTVKKLFAFIFGQNFEYCETQNKNLALNQLRIIRANLQDLTQDKDLNASHASLKTWLLNKWRNRKIRGIFANADYGRNQ